MRAILATALILLGGEVYGNPDRQTLYYWEVQNPQPGRAYWGWDSAPRELDVSGPVAPRRGESMSSFCSRQVGRVLRQDEPGLARALTMTNACLANGGRI